MQDNGGPTFPHALLPGSPAIDARDPNFTPPPWYDHRGPDFYRLRNNRVDIGSFEVQEGPAGDAYTKSDSDAYRDANGNSYSNTWPQTYLNSEGAPDAAPSPDTALRKIVISDW